MRLHLRSGKVTFLLCDDYDGLDVPNLIERVKVNLRRQSIRWFEYGSEEFPVQPVEGKVLFGRRWLPDVALAQVGMPLEGADAEPDPVKAAQGLQKTDGTVDPSELPAPSGMARSQG